MADMELIQNIHRVELDIEETVGKIKAIRQERGPLLEELPEYKGVLDLSERLKSARADLAEAVKQDSQISKIDEELSEYNFKLKDLRDILSHHLVVYFQDTGRDVVKDANDETRQIELKAKLGGGALDQEKLPFEQGLPEGVTMSAEHISDDEEEELMDAMKKTTDISKWPARNKRQQKAAS